MKKIDAQALKSNHRLEAVMHEFGERFRVQGDQWISTTSPGLTVNVELQIYEYTRPGMEKKAGDLYDWLKMRFRWTFKQAIQYLQKRDPDPEQDLSIEQPVSEPEEKKSVPLARHEWKFECKCPDEEKDSSGLYERGVVDRKGNIFYQYLLKPLDQWQARALEIGGEEIRECFTWEAWEIDSLRRAQPSHFVPVWDADIERCDECGELIDWWWKKKPQYEFSEVHSSGEVRFGSAFKKTPIYDSQEVYAFEYELCEETFCICEKCTRLKINYRQALSLLYKSAQKRDPLVPGRNVLKA